MGEVLFRRLFILFLLVCGMVVFSVDVFSVVHPLYSGFSSASSGFIFNNSQVIVSNCSDNCSGLVVPGYHCSSAGAHPGEGCVEWYGSAPDIGLFESNY